VPLLAFWGLGALVVVACLAERIAHCSGNYGRRFATVRCFRETNGLFVLRDRWIVWGGSSHMRKPPMKAWALLLARHPLGSLFM
jgi:hypothetical protein